MTEEDDQNIKSDTNQEENSDSDNRSNIVTDEEFYNELISASDPSEEHLIPDECQNEISGIEHLTSALHRRYNTCPVVFTGTLKDAIKEAFQSKEKRPLLIYINNDKSVYSNLFCQQLLCHEKIIEYLLNNYILWMWDVTYSSNGLKLNEIYKNAFSQWNVERQIGTKSTEQYPLLIGIIHHTNGDYLFKNLINGLRDRPIIDEFLACLIEHKDQFEIGEENLEREKTQHFHLSDLHQYSSDYQFDRSISMYQKSNVPFTRFLSNDNQQSYSSTRTFLPYVFQRMNIHPNDDADNEEEDDDDQTPIVTRSPPKFP